MAYSSMDRMMQSVKVYEMHIFKDANNTGWRNPTVHSIPVDPHCINTIESSSPMQNLRRLSPAQLAYLSQHLAETNRSLESPSPTDSSNTSTKKPSTPANRSLGRKPAQVHVAPAPAPPPPPPTYYDQLGGMDSSTMIYTPRPPSPTPCALPGMLPPPSPGAGPFPVPNTANSQNQLTTADFETPWKLDVVDFDVVPHTVCVRGRGRDSDVQVGVKAYRPAKSAEKEFTAVYSRMVAAKVSLPYPVRVTRSRSYSPPRHYGGYGRGRREERVFLCGEEVERGRLRAENVSMCDAKGMVGDGTVLEDLEDLEIVEDEMGG